MTAITRRCHQASQSAMALPMAVALSTTTVHGPAHIAQPVSEDANRVGLVTPRARGSTDGGASARAASGAVLRRKAASFARTRQEAIAGAALAWVKMKLKKVFG